MADHKRKATDAEAIGDGEAPETPVKGLAEKVQEGVRVAEAVTLSWSRKSLVTVYVCMWLMYFVRNLQSSLTSNLSPYITSGFEGHSLLTVISTVTNIMSAACTMPIAKILNLWDRSVTFVLMLFLSVLGLILMAACDNIATYCAAQVFYSVGSTGLIFAVDVLTSDTSSLRNRGLAFAFCSSPSMITAFAGSPLSDRFHQTDWRWAYGLIAIILPLVSTPLIVTWWFAKKKAMENEVLEKPTTTRTWTEGMIFYLVEFDLVGVVLLVIGFSLLLLPLTLAASQANKWQTSYIIAMIVVGGVVVIVFAIYERFFAPKPFIPYHLLANRTIIGACLLNMTYQIAYYCWNSYFTSYLQVVYDISLTQAGYIAAIFDFLSPICLIASGFLMRFTRRFRWQLWVAVPLYLLFVGLMIYFRSPGHGVGFICMCEIFISIGGGTMILISQVAVMAASKHEDYAAMLAFLGLSGSLGGAVGNSISGAIWTNTLPQKLQEYLPEATKSDWKTIYDNLEVQLSYPVGSATRDAIIAGYAMAQKNMLIAGTAIMALALGWVLLVRNIKLEDLDSFRGVVF